MNKTTQIPLVFISSTEVDLKQHRAAAEEAANLAQFHPVMMEYFAAQGKRPPYPACMAKVESCDVLVVIVAYRYGWVPPDQPGKKQKSITWLECEKALKDGKEVLAFVVDHNCNWPATLEEDYRITAALKEGKATPSLLAEIQQNVAKLKEFKQWLNDIGFRSSFTGPDDLKSQVLAALYQWRERHPEFQVALMKTAHDPAKYLQWLREQTAWIDIRGLQVGTGKANRFPISDLYIQLKAADNQDEVLSSKSDDTLDPVMKSSPLEEALHHRRLVINGDPGSGKTTFLKWLAYQLCCELVASRATQHTEKRFPLLIRIAELEECIRSCHSRQEAHAPSTKQSPAWLSYFLEYQGQEFKWNLNAEFFESKLNEQSTFVFLDGLDEAANQADRESMARLLENATRAYLHCHFVVTTRPGSYHGLATLAGFHQVTIDNLESEAIEQFLHHWSNSLYPGNVSGAESHWKELIEALRARIEIRRMARNPVMLTALAVVHWNEKRLPEQRADLYDSIVTWLARSRQNRPGRERAERCLALLGHLALAMQNQPKGRSTQLSLGRAAEMISAQFREIVPQERFDRAQAFLSEEEVDSGIVVSRGAGLRFWHLTFQEFLAARAISGLADTDQQKLLFASGKLHHTEWREVILLLAGILLVKQGREKVDGFVKAIFDHLGFNASLKNKAQCVGLLGAVLQDLRSLNYQPNDPRYESTLNDVLDIFNAEKSRDIVLQVGLEAAEALGHAGDPRLRSDENKWVSIPAGSFVMGAQSQDRFKLNYDPNAHSFEGPVHDVQLGCYRIGRYPVTVEQFKNFIDDDGYENRAWWKGGGFGKHTQPDKWEEQLVHLNRPVVYVTWYEAAAWCDWAGGRLPAEAEWERAARGSEQRKYPWGNEEPDPKRASYDRTGIHHATPVGLFPCGMTPEGIYDLAGNVWEWLADWYESYDASVSLNPTGPALGEHRVLRGGSWCSESRYLRSSNRGRAEPHLSNHNVGFRCVFIRDCVPKR